VVAVLVSVIDVVRRSANEPWSRIEMAVQPPNAGRYHRGGSADLIEGLRALRPGGTLFFANAEQMQDLLVAAGTEPTVRWVLMDLERVSDVDPTAAEALIEAAQEIRHAGRVLALSRVDAAVLAQLDRYGAFDVIARDRVYTSNREAELAFADAT
jgi:MFS superfamily sulfate permease-like transporter